MGSGVKGQTPLPKPPPWLRKVCGSLLAERIVTDKGVAHFLQGIIEDGGMFNIHVGYHHHSLLDVVLLIRKNLCLSL